jgi:hypothetical protein
MNIELIIETQSGTETAGHIALFYKCKTCGHWNELRRLTRLNNGNVFATLSEEETHESLCHKCDDVEVVTLRTRIKGWLELTDEERSELWWSMDWKNAPEHDYGKAVEAKLKEKNT